MDRLILTTTMTLLAASGAARAQGMADMPGMGSKPAHATHPPASAKPAAMPRPNPGSSAASAAAEDMAPMPEMSPSAPGERGPVAGYSPHPPRTVGPAAPATAMDHSQIPPNAMGGMGAGNHHMEGMDMGRQTSGALGPYAMTREASGTSWQPDASTHEGLHLMRGAWMIMLHGTLNGVYDWQQGRRGGEKAFVSGMLMGMAQRPVGEAGTLQLRAMLSPEPVMGKSGYPLHLATGETADGVNPLVDHQHPHDLFMELSASYSRRLSDKDSAFVYAGLPGEPAFGPPAFMHRLSILDSPEAPISHHWLDSTHITFGVLTAGYVHDNWKIEASRFRGREPDQHRFDIESPKLDSTAVRLSWNPNANWSLQGSWAQVKSPEQLEPDQNQRKLSASAIYTVSFGDQGWWSTTAAWGRRSSGHDELDAWVLESAVRPNRNWTVFSRAERVDNNELTTHGPTYTVSKVSIGAVRDWPLAEHVSFGLGGLFSFNFIPKLLEPAYGGDPHGAMAFVRLKLM